MYLCEYLCLGMCVWIQLLIEVRDTGPSRTGITVGYESPGQEWNSNPLKTQYVLLTAEAALHVVNSFSFLFLSHVVT